MNEPSRFFHLEHVSPDILYEAAYVKDADDTVHRMIPTRRFINFSSQNFDSW